ncbi:Uncharacterised protein [Salmonella enterica]|uniref:Uncharacterized protein n=1 Tax=Salmonella enterica TaxID=28901 RepID=A0A379QJC4_SALER|nr:Uncharacterised protein [Salmonella enterica]
MQIFKSDILNISTYSKKNGMKIIYIRDWVFIMIFSLIAVLYSLLFGRTMTEFLSLIKMDIKSCKIHSQ